MAIVKLDYKRIEGNSYMAYYQDKPLGLAFIVPEYYKIEDYNITFYDEEDGATPNFNATFELMGGPAVSYITIDSRNSVTFKDGLIVQVGKTLNLGENEGVTISGKDGVNKVFFDYFSLSKNSNSFIEFCKTTEEESSINSELHFAENSNAMFRLKGGSLRGQISKFKTAEPFILDLSSSSEINATSMTLKPFKDNNKLIIRAKKVGLDRATIKLKGDAKNGPSVIEQEKLDGIVSIGSGTRITLINSAYVTAKSDLLEITNLTGSSTSFSGENHFYAKGNITISGGEYLNTKIESKAKKVRLIEKNIINNSSLQIEPKEGSDEVTIKSLILQNSQLTNVVGKFSGNIANCLADGIDARDGGNIFVFATINKAQKQTSFINIKNLTFKDGGSLSIVMKVNSDKSFTNSVVEGDSLLATKSPCEITNSILHNSNLEIDNDDKVTISNSYLSGKVVTKNISNIDCSNLESVEVASKESGISLSEENLCSLEIDDYKSFCKKREKDDCDIAQNKLEIL